MTPQQPDDTERPTFDVAVMDKLRAAFQGVFLAHPEVASLAVSINWAGNLNDAGISHGMWLNSDGGSVRKPDVMMGSVFQTMKLLSLQVAKTIEYAEGLRGLLEDTTKEVLKKREELKEIEAAIAAAQKPRRVT